MSEPVQRSRLRRFFRALSRVIAVLLVLGLIAAGLGYRWLDQTVLANLPTDLSSLRDFRPLTAVRVFARDGSQVDEFYLERRVWVPIDELPEHVWRAFLVAEDRRFFEHEGVDFLGIGRAILVNLAAGQVEQGGSTLTQQLVKNLLVGKEKSYRRKLREAVLAWRLERSLSKREILELYLNYVPLGSGNYGVEAAARDYFGVSARNLDPGQAALLAGLVPAPSRYSPRANPALARERRRIVLDGMVTDGLIRRELLPLFNDAPVLNWREGVVEDRPALAYVTEVRREVRRALGSELPFSLGLQVHTALDLEVQRVAEDAVRTALEEHLARQGVRGPTRRIEPDERDAWLQSAPGFAVDAKTGFPLPPTVGMCFEALVPDDRDLHKLQAADLTFDLNLNDFATLVASDEPETPPRPLSEVVLAGDLLRVCVAEGGGVELAARPWAEGAAVVMENSTGRIVALVGGYQDSLEGFVRATQARRQPGSSFKPYVYAAALLHGHTQLDTVLDGPISMPAGGGKSWSPHNYEDSFAGPVLLRRALAKSLNTVAVRLILETGAAEVARVAAAMGVRTPIRTDLTIALGSSEVTPMDQALGYSTIARGGLTADPVFIDGLADAEGAPLGQAGGEVLVDGHVRAELPGGPGTRALPAGVAYELLDMLRGAVQSGTARKAKVDGLDRAGKTGTTNGYQDAWFCGLTPRYTVVVWVGTDGTRPLGETETGARTALPAWMQIVDALNEPVGSRFAVPAEAVFVPLDREWVALPRGSVPSGALSVARATDAPLPAFGARVR